MTEVYLQLFRDQELALVLAGGICRMKMPRRIFGEGCGFDAVLIYDGSKTCYGRESERKLFYTACSRPLHMLHIYAIGELSEFIASQPAETYVIE